MLATWKDSGHIIFGGQLIGFSSLLFRPATFICGIDDGLLHEGSLDLSTDGWL